MYATLDDLISLFGREEIRRLSDRPQTGELDEAVVTDALLRASSEVDSYLCGRFRVPLEVPVPAVVASATCDIARYRMGGGDVEEGNPVVERYGRAVAWLRDVAAGKAGVPGFVTGDEGDEGAGVLFSPGTRPWEGVL